MRDRDLGSSDGRWTAFEAEAMPHVDRLFRLAMWWERDRREAEDLVQDTLVQALQSFHRFTAGTNCRAWLVTILRHVRSNRRRTTLRRLAAEEPDDRIEETVAFVPPVPQHLSDEDVLAALRGIPEAYQDIILLCDVEGLTYKEIATALMIPIGTVMSRLHRGRTLLRQRLASTLTIGVAPRLVDVTSSKASK
jgi:RNA polymerase sigma-70 factor (ECF subfamily)